MSFFALIKKAKELGTRVICGDSSSALKNADHFGATEARHAALNNEIFTRIKEVVAHQADLVSFVILCGDTHLLEKKNSPSLPKLVKDHFQDSSISVFIQADQATVKGFKDYTESHDISYIFLPANVPTVITEDFIGEIFSISSEKKKSSYDSFDSLEKFKKEGNKENFMIEEGNILMEKEEEEKTTKCLCFSCKSCVLI